jgi:hypothetical protein
MRLASSGSVARRQKEGCLDCSTDDPGFVPHLGRFEQKPSVFAIKYGRNFSAFFLIPPPMMKSSGEKKAPQFREVFAYKSAPFS